MTDFHKINCGDIGGYNNNPNLRRENNQIDFTQEMIEERIRCSMDPIYFLEKYMKIINLDKGFVTIKLYDFQKQLFKAYLDNRFTIAKLPRQVGKTTVTVGFILWTVLFRPDQNIAILANKASTARDILQKLTLSYESIPLWLQQGVRSWNKGSIELENNSKIVAASTSSSAGRSGSYNLVFLDEFAFVPRNIAEAFMTSVYPTISSGTNSKIIMVSTPNGMNLFYKFWTDAVEKRNLYIPITAHWSCVPGRDEKWKAEQIKQIGEEKFNQEFNTEFLGSSNTLIAATKLSTLTWNKPIDRQYNALDIFEIPNQEDTEGKSPDELKQFILSVDSSRGGGDDYSAFNVIDINQVPYRVVAKYRDNKVSPMEYANIIVHVAKRFNDAHILIESNDIGAQICDIIHYDFEYENIFSTKSSAKNSLQAIIGYSKATKFGIRTTSSVKNIGCANLKNLIESDRLFIQDFDIISEFTSFVRTANSYAAEPGCTDDLVMSLVLFAWLTTQDTFKMLSDESLKKSVFNQIESDSDGPPLMQVSNPSKKEEEIDTEFNLMDKSAVWTSDSPFQESYQYSYFKKL